MPTLLWSSPGWLWGLGALAVPLAIHLLSRGTARRVAVGSVALLVAGSSRKARRIRFTDAWLALLRVLLLVWLVLALAGPRLLPRPVAGVWGLAEPGVVDRLRQDPGAAPRVADRLEALAATGDLRLLAAGLPRVAVTEEAVGKETGDREASAAGGIWSLLLEAEATAPPGTRFEVFSYGTVDALIGRRPELDHEVSWRIVTPSPGTWTARATRLADGVRRWTARSSPGITTVTPAVDPSTVDPSTIRSSAGIDASEAAPTAIEDAMARAEPLRISVYTEPARMGDADDVVAALTAIEGAGWLSLAVARITVAPTPTEQEAPEQGPPEQTPASLAPPEADVAIWLAARPFLDSWQAWIAAGGVLIQDAPTRRYRDCRGQADLPGGLATIAVRRCIVDAEAPSAGMVPGASAGGSMPVWRDRKGRTLLSASVDGKVWTLAGRFHPTWSDLVRSPAFPHWLAQWLDHQARQRGQVVGAAPQDRRQASAADRQVAVTPSTDRSSAAEITTLRANLAETRHLAPWLWGLLALTLVVERSWARRRAA